MKLFCLPYAGASASVYSKWKRMFSPKIEVVPVELAGRGARMSEPFYPDIQAAIHDIAASIAAERHDQPFGLFGHSMGSLLIYELYQYLARHSLPLPVCMFFSGNNPPHLKLVKEDIHALPDEPFIEQVSSFGAIEASMFADPSLRNLFLPILRNDFRLVETRELNRDCSVPIQCPSFVMYGTEDSLLRTDMTAWQELVAGTCQFFPFAGGHFYLNQWENEVVSLIEKQIIAATAVRFESGRASSDVR